MTWVHLTCSHNSHEDRSKQRCRNLLQDTGLLRKKEGCKNTAPTFWRLCVVPVETLAPAKLCLDLLFQEALPTYLAPSPSELWTSQS